MLFIVLYHLCRHGFSLYLYDYSITVNNVFIKGMNLLEGLSNCIFLMISGYFLVDNHFSWRKVFRLVFQCFCISAFVGTVLYVNRIPSVVHGGNLVYGFDSVASPLTKSEWKMYLRPIFFNLNWFTTVYLPFYIFSPYLAVLVKNISKGQLTNLIYFVLILGFVLNMWEMSPWRFSRLFYFCAIFFVAAYIKIYRFELLLNWKKWFLCAFLILIAYYSVVIGIHLIGRKFGMDVYERLRIVGKIQGMEHVPMILCSVCIFCGFKNIEIKSNRWINIIASTTLTVYLLHDNNLHRDFVWQKIFNLLSWYQSVCLIPYSIFCVISIFAFGVCLELLRKRFIECYVLKLYDFIALKVCNFEK